MRWAGDPGAVDWAGTKALPHAWPVLSAHFRDVLMAPRRLDDDAGVEWVWTEPRERAEPSAAECAAMRRRLSAGVEAVREWAETETARTDGRAKKKKGGEVAEIVDAMAAWVRRWNEQPDAEAGRWIARTEHGWRLHSWGGREAAAVATAGAGKEPKAPAGGGEPDAASPEDEAEAMAGESPRPAAERALHRRRAGRWIAALLAVAAGLVIGVGKFGKRRAETTPTEPSRVATNDTGTIPVGTGPRDSGAGGGSDGGRGPASRVGDEARGVSARSLEERGSATIGKGVSAARESAETTAALLAGGRDRGSRLPAAESMAALGAASPAATGSEAGATRAAASGAPGGAAGAPGNGAPGSVGPGGTAASGAATAGAGAVVAAGGSAARTPDGEIRGAVLADPELRVPRPPVSDVSRTGRDGGAPVPDPEAAPEVSAGIPRAVVRETDPAESVARNEPEDKRALPAERPRGESAVAGEIALPSAAITAPPAETLRMEQREPSAGRERDGAEPAPEGGNRADAPGATNGPAFAVERWVRSVRWEVRVVGDAIVPTLPRLVGVANDAAEARAAAWEEKIARRPANLQGITARQGVAWAAREPGARWTIESATGGFATTVLGERAEAAWRRWPERGEAWTAAAGTVRVRGETEADGTLWWRASDDVRAWQWIELGLSTAGGWSAARWQWQQVSGADLPAGWQARIGPNGLARLEWPLADAWVPVALVERASGWAAVLSVAGVAADGRTPPGPGGPAK